MLPVSGIGIIGAAANAASASAPALGAIPPASRRHGITPVLCEHIGLPHGPEATLHQELSQRTGLDAVRAQVHRVALLRDAIDISPCLKRESKSS